MFRIAKQTTVDWPVTVNIPRDGGTTVKATFTARFEVIGQSEADEIIYGGADGVRDLLKRVLVGWKGVADEGGTETEFSEEARGALLDIVYARAALFEAYGRAANGKGREKN